MPVTAADLVLLGSINRPEDDTATVGGAKDVPARPIDTQIAATGDVEIVSDGADVRTFVLTFRDAAGDIQTWNPTLNGATPVIFGSATVERVLKGVLSSGDSGRVVTLREDASGPTIHTFENDETDCFRFFQRSTSESSQAIRYEKCFWINNHATLSLTTAELELTADPTSKIRQGVEASKDDTATATNRKTAPGGVTFVDDSVVQNVPTGSLAAGEAIGFWIEMDLAADEAASKFTFTTQLDGQTV